MEKEMEKGKNMILMVIQYLKVSIYILTNYMENIILVENQNMKVNIYMIKNIMEKDMKKMVI